MANHFGARSFRTIVWLVLTLALTLVTLRSADAADESTRNKIKIRKTSHLQAFKVDESEEYNAEKMELLAQKRHGLMLDIKRFIRDARDADQKAELNLRLGGLYMEEYYALLARDQVQFERADKEYKANPKGKKPPKFDNSDAMAGLDKAEGIYRDLLTRYPKNPRRDEMLYFLAMAALDKSHIDEGMRYFKQIYQETPNSRYGNDALVQLGDYYFDNNKFTEAQSYYEKIVAKKYKPLITYSI